MHYETDIQDCPLDPWITPLRTEPRSTSKKDNFYKPSRIPTESRRKMCGFSLLTVFDRTKLVTFAATFWTAGTTWIPEDPLPITATLLPSRSYFALASAVWWIWPPKSWMPGISGHAQLLTSGWAYSGAHYTAESKRGISTYLRMPEPFIKISHESSITLLPCRTFTFHFPACSSHTAETTLELSCTSRLRLCSVAIYFRYFKISSPDA